MKFRAVIITTAVILAVAAAARANPEIREMEANPLFAYEHGVVAVAVRAML